MAPVTNLRMVVGFVGSVLVLSVLGIVSLAFRAQPIPDVLQNVAVGCMTLLGGLLVPTQSRQ